MSCYKQNVASILVLSLLCQGKALQPLDHAKPSMSWRSDAIEAFRSMHVDTAAEENEDDVPMFLRDVSPQCLEDYDKFKAHLNDSFFGYGHDTSGLWAKKSKH